MRISSLSLTRSLLYRPDPSLFRSRLASLSFRLRLPPTCPRFSLALPSPSSRSFSRTLFPFSGFANRRSGHDHTDGYRDSSRFSLFSLSLSLSLFLSPAFLLRSLFFSSLSLSLSQTLSVRWGSFTIPRLLSLYRVHLIPVFFFSLSLPFFSPFSLSLFFFRSTVLHEGDDDDRNGETHGAHTGSRRKRDSYGNALL